MRYVKSLLIAFRNEWLDEPNNDLQRLSSRGKIAMIPLMLIWFIVQLLVFSIILGMFSVLIGIIGLIIVFFEKESDYNFPIFLILLPLLGPFIWWYRYIKFGEYNIFIQ